MMRKQFILVILCAITVYGCAVNPVTGKKQIRLITESQELRIGSQQYSPSRQMQGGDYEVDPSLTKYVNSVGQRLAAVSDRKLPYEFVVINNSVPNAWALPGGKIAVNRGLLLEMNNEAELAAVLGHEVVHAAARHGARSMERGMLLQGAVAVTGIATRGGNYANLAVRGAQMAAGLITQKYGRDAEREADFYGMQYMSQAGYDPQAAVSLQKVFVRLSKDRDTDWLSGLFSSHPPSQERVEANRVTARTLPATGELGIQRYKKKIARLKETKEFYEAHDKGREALSKGNTKEALALAQKAIRGEPDEGIFYALLGDASFKQHQFKNTLINYDKAVERNDKFFYFYAQRGLTKEKLGDRHGARSDLEKSIDLLPTATALNALGNMSLAQGDRQKAMKYYIDASTSNSEPGRQAARSLFRLDMPENPNRYLKTRIRLDQKRHVIVEIANSTSVHVRNVNVLIHYPDSQGKTKEITRKVQGIIAPGKATLVQSGIGPVGDQNALKYMRVSVIMAEVVE